MILLSTQITVVIASVVIFLGNNFIARCHVALCKEKTHPFGNG
jgi:hypothetical protein